jgi:hypothetical protein
VADEVLTSMRVEPRRGTPRSTGHVYFIQLGNRIKIGHSIDVRRRLTEVPHEQVLATVPGSPRDEARCHAAFKHLRTSGEWFRAEPDLLEFIADLPSVEGMGR